jgi:hypothetical protein
MSRLWGKAHRSRSPRQLKRENVRRSFGQRVQTTTEYVS